MGEVQYMVSEAAKRTGVDEHLLLYWEKNLSLPCGRTENGHRYYTDEDIRLFGCIKELLEQGIRIGDLKEVIPDILHTKEALQKRVKEETPESLLASVLRSVLAENNPILEKQISETQGELTADSKDALPDQKTIEANKKKNETERKKEERQEQEDEKEAEITISVDEATPVDLDSYVQIQPVSSKASSELDDNTAEKAIDGQEVTSWQEDVAGYGHGENLTLKFEKTYTVKYLALKLGSWKDDAAYEQNNRPKELDIQTDHLIRKVTFSDEKKEYWVTFSDTSKTSELKLIIEQVYRGLKTNWNDTCIAEVQVYGTEE